MAALLPAVVSALSLPGGFESSEHSFAMDEGAPRECDMAQHAACLAEHEACLLFDGHAADKPSACACATQLYGVCLRAAGCAAAAMPECVARLLAQECGDMSVCGSNCYTDDELLPGAGDDAARVLPVNNFGADYLRFSVCDKSYVEEALLLLLLLPLLRIRRLATPHTATTTPNQPTPRLSGTTSTCSTRTPW